MADQHDDLDAIRTIVDALSPFDTEEQKRIIRWAFEKLGMTSADIISAPVVQPPLPPTADQATLPAVAPPATSPSDIKTFVSSKDPSSDIQFAATIAYFYAFEAPEEQKKEEVGSADLQEACRLTGRARLQDPGQTLRNAAYNGLLDKGAEKGAYKINTVGENLVALTLPGTGGGTQKQKQPRKRTKRKASAKKTAKKKAAKKPNARK